MDKRFKIGTVVELLPDKDSVYEKLREGARGVVLDRKIDEGFDMLLIEWDKDHPSYQGEKDCWTFESHFAPVETTGGFFNVLEDRERYLEKLGDRLRSSDKEEFLDDFIDSLDDAINALSECDGYLIITITKKPGKNENEVLLLPEVFTGVLSPVTMIALEAETIQLAMMAHQELTSSLLSHLSSRAEEDDDE